MTDEEYKKMKQKQANRRNGPATAPKKEEPRKEVKELRTNLKSLFTMNRVMLCVAVAMCAMLPTFAVDAIMHRAPKKETIVMFCQFNGGLLGMTCN